MITSRHHFFIYPFFKCLSSFLVNKSFNDVILSANNDCKIDKKKSLLIISNHISWWDGFWIVFLNKILIKKKIHFMMLEKQLKKHWYFRYVGGYSIKKDSKTIIESLNYTNQLLSNPNNMVFLFPQGKINSLYNDKIKFEKGISRILQRSDENYGVMFLANFVDYFSESKPTLFMNYKLYNSDDLKVENLELCYQRFYSDYLSKHRQKVS